MEFFEALEEIGLARHVGGYVVACWKNGKNPTPEQCLVMALALPTTDPRVAEQMQALVKQYQEERAKDEQR